MFCQHSAGAGVQRTPRTPHLQLQQVVSFTNCTSRTIIAMVVLVSIAFAAYTSLPLIYKLKEIALLQTKTPAPIKVSPVVCIGFLCYKTTGN